jgi:hypothetical protein
MNKLDKLIDKALINQKKIDETLEFLNKNLTEEESEIVFDKIGTIIEEELVPEIENLELNIKFKY